jgi:hypothetical protein
VKELELFSFVKDGQITELDTKTATAGLLKDVTDMRVPIAHCMLTISRPIPLWGVRYGQ